MAVTVSIRVDASRDRVWAELSDLASHPEWMKDAESITFTSEQTGGVGTSMEVLTRVGPLRTTDIMEVTGWTEGESIEIAHYGVVKGRGKLEVTPDGDSCLVSWTEELFFPWWVGGLITAALARPVMTRIWAGNLRGLAARVNSP